MGGRRRSLVVVARLWRDDDGVRGVVESSAGRRRRSCASLGAAREAVLDALRAWQQEDEDPPNVGPSSTGPSSTGPTSTGPTGTDAVGVAPVDRRPGC